MEFSSFISGILAALTPCVAALYPLVLYRFARLKSKNLFRFYLQFVAGYIFVFLLIGLFLESVFSLAVQNAVKIILAIILILAGFLEYRGKIKPLESIPVKNPFIFASIFAATLSLNPCTLPFMSTLIATSINMNMIFNMLLFALGLLVPPSFFLLAGKNALIVLRKSSKTLSYFEKLFPLLLIISGIYIGISTTSITQTEVLIVSAGLFLIFGIIIYYLLLETKSKGFQPSVAFLILSSILLLISFTHHCYNSVPGEILSCSSTCTVCRQCLILFSTAAVFLLLGSFMLEKSESN